MRNFILLYLVLLSCTLSAQNATVSGKITDSATSEPLTGATVKAGTTGASSDLEGLFKLSLPPGTYELSVSMVGYETTSRQVRLAAGDDLKLDIALNDGANLLQTATVTSGKFEKPLGEVTVSLDVIKSKLIENVNSTSVD
ncbi:MAG: carboxypeptidase-like regulatory domain-containing protein, partial [Bacteroidota bacterium]